VLKTSIRRTKDGKKSESEVAMCDRMQMYNILQKEFGKVTREIDFLTFAICQVSKHSSGFADKRVQGQIKNCQW
jgi:hypothetical protein